MLVVIGSKRLKQIVSDAVREAEGLVDRAATLQKKIADMEIAQAKKQEEWDRREREVEHKVGLERKRQEFEIQQAKRETTNQVKEENLKADKERFKSEMDFQRERLEGEVKALRTLTEQLLERLPSAQIIANVGTKK